MEKNKLVLSGRLITKNTMQNGDDYIVVFAKSGGAKDVYIRIRCPGGLKLSDYTPRMHVSLTAHLHSFVRMTPKGFRMLSQEFVLDSIEQDKPAIGREFGVPGGKFYERGDAKFLCSGELTEMKHNNGWDTFVVKTDTPSGKQTHVTMTAKTPDRPFELRPGDKICAVAYVSSAKKEYDGKNRYFENIVVCDIGKVN